jgi:hypothetical protein
MIKSPKPQPPKPARPPRRKRSPSKPKRKFENRVPALQIPSASGQTPRRAQSADPAARSDAETAAIARLLRAMADELDPPPDGADQ